MRWTLEIGGKFGLALLLAASASIVIAQETQPSEQPQDAASSQSGLLGEIGKFLKNPVDSLPSFSKSDPPADPPKPDAATPVAPVLPPATAPAPVTGSKAPPPAQAPTESTRLLPGMVTGRELCPTGTNGAPDCQTGSDRLCQSKGYKSGKSLNTDSAFSCSARIARATGGKACGNEHFVTSAFCN